MSPLATFVSSHMRSASPAYKQQPPNESSAKCRETERRFPVRIRIAVPDRGLGQRLTQMHDWLDQNAGAEGWAMTPSGDRGVVNDAISIHLVDATIASAFVARWCAGHRAEASDGIFRIRDDEPTQRVLAAHHKTP
jgi:hypothetical protein